jgi:3-deoxy-D-manno-octulosonate 8-phosphate phosphatase (KDO 8-P phosphatase)
MTNLKIKEKASKIKVLAFDVDGVMTDCSLIFDENGVEYKKFHGRDGQGIELLHRAGLVPAIITKRNNGTIEHRAKVLGITELHMGQKNKLEALDEIVEKYGITYDEISYMGDDLPDVCVLEKVGLPCCPADAVDEVKERALFVTSKNGGKGAVRELCELVLKTQGFDLVKLINTPAKVKCGT